MTTPTNDVRRKPMGELSPYDHAARLFEAPELDAAFTSSRTDGFGLPRTRKTDGNARGGPKRTAIWRIPAYTFPKLITRSIRFTLKLLVMIEKVSVESMRDVNTVDGG
ncbi:MAG TPA: hypothetical protein VFE36_04455 [Candidatus Baltobacteraceae bacterium]|jgi:hypothetical protein|nr:hypothetical protein [Candidatus Baltobacteraceae bacterium]